MRSISQRIYHRLFYKAQEKNSKDIINDYISCKKLGHYYEKEVICSVTTIPSRIDVVEKSIESILFQTARPNKVVLYLGKKEFESIEIPDTLKALIEYGLEIHYIEDLRVHTKYFYAFKEFPKSIVITFDDDQQYRPDLIENLLKCHEKFPAAIACTRAHKILSNNGIDFKKYEDWIWEDIERKPSFQIVATGVGGVLYVPALFNSILFDSDKFLSICPNQDDLWLKCVEIISNIPVVTTKRKVWNIEINNSQEKSLNSSNVHKNINDRYWESLMTFFNLTFESFNRLYE